MQALFLTSWSAASDRTAVLAQERDSIWLYLTDPGGHAPTHDCWVANLVSAPAVPDPDAYLRDGTPPPAPADQIRARPELDTALVPTSHRWSLSFAADGHAVGVLCDDTALAVIDGDGGARFSYLLAPAVDEPWGRAWDEAAVMRLFGVEVAGASDR